MDGGFLPIAGQATLATTAAPAGRGWTEAERDVLRRHFASGGAPACRKLLPHRSESAIYYQAHTLGLRSAQQKQRGPVWTSSEHIDAAIRRTYQSPDMHKGVVNRLAATLGRPAWWVKKRAVKLGAVRPRRKEPPWSERELELLEQNAHKHPDRIRGILKRNGFARTATAIVVKLKRESLDRTDPDHFTANALATFMGVDGKTVTRWIERLGLKAKRRGTARTEAQGGDQWWINRKDFRAFVGANAAAIDLRKVVDKEWFIDLLVNGGGA